MGKLRPYERQMLICDRCKSSDHLESDSLCTFCTNCGPSASVSMRVHGAYLPIPSLPRHDEPISAEDYERREWARREAEKVIADRFSARKAT